MLISHTYKAIFVHIQRTGGNSIQKTFEEHDPSLVETIAPHPSRKRTKHCYISDIAAAVEPEVLSGYTKFAVVRNPFDRLASWYAHFRDGGNPGDLALSTGGRSRVLEVYQHGVSALSGHPGATLAWRRGWAAAYRAISPGSPEEVALRFEAIGASVAHEVNRRAPTFEDFVRLPREHPDGIFERFHANQVDYLSADPGRPSPLLVDHVLRFETMAADFAALAERLGFPGRLPHLNASGRDRRLREVYSPEARRIVEERFARDCERFGYAFEPLGGS